jgi:solute carrier family 45, member 1/2/4
VVALIWLSGLVAAVITHPCFGIWSDNIRTPWGRRRPFIVVGTLFAILSLLSFAWIKDIVDGGISFVLGNKPPPHTYHLIISIGAALCVSCLSIAIQAIQCGIRALIVDKCPLCQQDAASGFASCMVGAGNIISYSLGSVDLSKFFPLGGEAQVKSLSLIILILLGLTTSLTCIFITEDNTRAYRRYHQLKDSWVLLRCFKQVISAARKLSPLTIQVYVVQFFTWIGWYIFLNYNTVYVSSFFLSTHP